MKKSDNKPCAPQDPTAGSLNRRGFLTGVASLAGGAATLSAATSAGASTGCENSSACRTPGCDYDVLVIGGGFAGATAARDLEKAGFKTLLIEARNRLGGRTFSTEFEGIPIELGGTWVHNTQPFVWAEIQRYGIPVVETPGAVADDMRFVMPDGRMVQLSAAQLEEIAIGWQTYCARARELLPRPYDLKHNREAVLQADSISALDHLASLELTPLQENFIKTMISVFVNSLAEEMSYLEVLRFQVLAGDYFPTLMDATTRFKLEGGTGGLIDAIIEDGSVDYRLSTVVKSIKDSGEKVAITTTRGETIHCGAVISTVPMNTISRISFEPPLPAGVIEAGNARHPGRGMKMFLKVKGDLGNFAAFSSHLPMNYAMTYKRGADYTLVVAFGNPDRGLDPYDEESLQQALRHYLPDVEVSSIMHYDWSNDPYSLGTWATYRTGWISRYYDQFQAEQGRVFFASGDHGEGWRGTIDGAIGAGSIAARKVSGLLA